MGASCDREHGEHDGVLVSPHTQHFEDASLGDVLDIGVQLHDDHLACSSLPDTLHSNIVPMGWLVDGAKVREDGRAGRVLVDEGCEERGEDL